MVVRLMVVVGLLALPGSYVGAYYRLSRASLRDNATDYGTAGILYVPLREVFPPDGNARSPIRRRAIFRHYALATAFAPLNWVDRHLFGTPPPAGCFLMLSDRADDRAAIRRRRDRLAGRLRG